MPFRACCWNGWSKQVAQSYVGTRTLPLLFYVLSSSGVLADCMIVLLFCWHSQQRSVIAFITVICRTSCRQSLQKVVYAAALILASSAELVLHRNCLLCTGTGMRSRLHIFNLQVVLLSHYCCSECVLSSCKLHVVTFS